MAKRLKGLYRDCEPIDQPPDTYRYANNALLSEQVGSIMSDYGLTELDVTAELGTDFTILGHVSINKGRVVIFSVNTNGTGSKISVINPDSSIDVKIQNYQLELNFSPNSEIDATYKINKDLEAVVYFTDGINPPRFVNIDNFEIFSSADKYNIFNNIEKAPIVSLRKVNNVGGILGTGAYYFAVRYVDKDGNKTNFLSISNSVYINDDDSDIGGDGAEPNTPTSKSVSIEISNVDTFYNEIEIAVIKKEGGTFLPVRILPKIGLTLAQTIVYTYQGNESYTEGSLDEILINNASYQTAKTIEQADSILYMGNLTKAKDIGYQKYANNIQLEAVGSEVLEDFLFDSSKRYTNPDISFRLKGYQRDEVYAFYISFILNDGSETKAYHIPGRPPSSGETDNLSSFETELNNTFGIDTYSRVNSFTDSPKKFHFINNWDSILTTGYWENENETYPNTDDWDIWEVSNGVGQSTGNTLRNQKVRHHRMPDHERKPLITNELTQVQPLLIKLYNVNIPNDIKEKVKGYKVYYAKTNNFNKRVIDQSFVWPLFSGTDPVITGNGDFHYISCLPKSDQTSYELDSSHPSQFDLRAYSAIPFYSMKNKESLGPINYIQKIYVPTDITVSKINNEDEKSSYRFINNTGFKYRNDPSDFNIYNFNNGNTTSSIVPISAKAFVPHAQNVVELKSKGFPYNATTINSESQILLYSSYVNNISNPVYDQIKWNNNDGSPKEYSFIANLMSYKTDLYNSFDSQELIWTGYTQTDLDQTETGNIGGGDIFLCRHTMRISGRAIKTNNDPIYKSVIDYVVESRDNVELRHNGNEYYEIYYKGFPSNANPVLSIEENEANLDGQGNPIDFFDNYYGYNIDYRAVQDIKTAIPYEKIQRFESIKFPTRVIRSQEVEPGSSSDFFRTFLENDFKDFGYNRGDLVKINKYANNLLLHMERAIMITRGREELATGDFRAFLGAGNIFAVEPNELLMSEDGTGGLQNQHHSLLTEEGYFFVDQEEGSIYSLTSNGLANISDIGMRNEFEKILPWNLSQYASFNPYNADKRYIGINFGYDKEHSRIFFVKRDVIPSQDFITKLSNGTITLESDGQFYEGGNKIEYSSSYFTPNNFCLSYVPQLNAWVSYHTNTPSYYVNSLQNFYSLSSDNRFYKHNNKLTPLISVKDYVYQNYDWYNYVRTLFKDSIPTVLCNCSLGDDSVLYTEKDNDLKEIPFEFGFVENRSPAETKIFYSLSLITSVKDKDGVEYKDKTFTNFQLFTALQDSGSQEIIPFQSLANQGNARNVNGTWMINKFRTPNDEWWKRSRFMDKYVEVLLTYYNYDNNFLYLTNSEVGVKKTVR
jgi:hypothetical protein